MTDTPGVIQIRQSGNMLAVSDAKKVLPVLSNELFYWKREMSAPRRGQPMKMSNTRVNMYSTQDDTLYALAGFLNRICRTLKKSGFLFNYTRLDGITYPEPDFDSLRRMIPDMEMLYGQQNVLAYMVSADRGTFKAPTGYGKSYLARAFCALYPTARIVICGPASDIVTSTYERILNITPHVGRVGGGYNDPDRITVCTAHSLHKVPMDKVDFLIYDEVHTAPAPTHQYKLGKIRRPKMFGFSANLSGRGDGADIVIEGLFGPMLFEVTYQKAVEHNIVLPIEVHVLRLQNMPARYSAANHDNPVSKKRWFYWRNKARNKMIADYVTGDLEKSCCRENPQVLILVETLEHALFLRQYLPDYKLVYASADLQRLKQMEAADLFDSRTDLLDAKARKKLRLAFEAGDERKVIATSCWGTGVDFPSLDALVVAGGPASEILSTQWPGRVSRIHRGGDKTKGIVVDCSDEIDEWGYNRYKKRRKVYNDKGWKFIQVQGQP